MRQGGVLSPFLWVVFTDPLLEAQAMLCEGVSIKAGGGGKKLKLWGGCFMDDTFWLASNREDMQKRVEMHWVWCQYNGIKINIDKSTYTYVPSRGKEKADPPPPP